MTDPAGFDAYKEHETISKEGTSQQKSNHEGIHEERVIVMGNPNLKIKIKNKQKNQKINIIM